MRGTAKERAELRQVKPNNPSPEKTANKTREGNVVYRRRGAERHSAPTVAGAPVWSNRPSTRAHNSSEALPEFRSVSATPEPLPHTPPGARLHAP